MNTGKGNGKGEYGEGNYKASREYNEATKEFVESGRVEDAARKAQPANAAEAAEMQRAEAKGRERAREEDPALSRTGNSDPAGKPVTDRPADQTTTPKPGQEGH
jgi:hypothetical protein